MKDLNKIDVHRYYGRHVRIPKSLLVKFQSQVSIFQVEIPTNKAAAPIPIIDAFHCASAVEVPSVHGSTTPFKENMFFLQLCLDASLKEKLENPVKYRCFSAKSPKSIQNTCI